MRHRSPQIPVTFFPLLLLFLPVLAACAGRAAEREMPTAVPTPIVAQKPTYTVERGTVTRALRLNGRVAPVQQQDLFFRSDGFVRAVYVARGDQVQAGDVLARLDEPEKYAGDIANAQVEVEKARHDLDELLRQAPLKAAEAQLEMVEAGKALKEAQRNRTRLNYSRDGDELVVEQAHTDYLLAKQVFKDAQKAYNRVAHKKLTNPERVTALRALLDARNAYDRALAIWNWYLMPWPEDEIAITDAGLALALEEYDQARERWELLQEGPDPFELSLAEAQVSDAQARLASTQKALENVELRAPFDGEVLSIGITPGTQVTSFKGVLTLADPRALEIVVFPGAEDLAALGVGQPASVTFTGRSGGELSAHVRQVPFTAGSGTGSDSQAADQSVRIELDQSGVAMTLNEAAAVIIHLDTREDVLWLPPGALRAFQGRDFVFIEQNGVQRRVDVQLGLRSAERVEILAGLQEGQVVLGQ